ncbi:MULTISPECIES: hypothetical protein [Nostocales]|uniref:Uncharacterized protein n=3 Tax=Nostocales TaxID=1161 RepID=A0A0C1N4V3_9CYAN|nr:hypothetical protein [Tolypothrix bouteillei]KAF3889061.1 hypothetical protein DA73_0400028965 [Tolypothrix bouteillei VB521301]
MKNIKFLTSACRYCRHYQPEGRRGGVCQQLGAPVRGDWKACSLALPPFAPSWENLKDVWSLPDAKIVLASGLNQGAIPPVEETIPSSPEPVKTYAREALKV